jgi:diguanylate cyclase (GGDEF)-like protein
MLLNQDTSELLVEAKTSPDDILNENMKTSVGEGIAGKVLKKGVSLLVENLEKDPRINQKNKPRYKTKSFLCIPLKIEDRVIGVLNISDKITGDAFNDKDLRIMQSFGANASIALERCFLYKKTEELKELSIKDSLTGVFNRRYFSNRLSEEISRFNRYKQPFSILMIDIDEFKKHNDTHGHLIGDKILKILGATILSSLRNLDIAARYGGDEFILLLSQTPKIDAVNIANRIKENIEKAYLSYQEELTFSDITVSIGLASFPDDASSATELIEKADQALYLAKKSGRNRLVYL